RAATGDSHGQRLSRAQWRFRVVGAGTLFRGCHSRTLVRTALPLRRRHSVHGPDTDAQIGQGTDRARAGDRAKLSDIAMARIYLSPPHLGTDELALVQ